MLLSSRQVGTIATINKDGTPYCVPVHFVYADGKIYIHGLPAGQKIDNLIANPNVCLSVYNMDCLLFACFHILGNGLFTFHFAVT